MKSFRLLAPAIAMLASVGLGAYGLLEALSESASRQAALTGRQSAQAAARPHEMIPAVATAPPPANLVPGQQVPMVYASQTGLADGTYTGDRENAYYGWVRIELVVQGGRVTDVQVLEYPNDNGTSRYINSVALPYLVQETVQAQSAQIYLVSGATFTSEAFAKSLGSAFVKAGA